MCLPCPLSRLRTSAGWSSAGPNQCGMRVSNSATSPALRVMSRSPRISRSLPELAGERVEPFVAFVGAHFGLAGFGRDQQLPGGPAVRLAGQRDHDAAPAASRFEPDTGVSDVGGADEFFERHLEGLGYRQEQLEAGFALAGLQPGQSALGDPVAAASCARVIFRW